MKNEPESKETLLSDYLERIENFQGVVHQYGQEKSRVLFGEKLVATVLYPETGIAELDIAIEKFIDETIASAQLDSGEKELLEAAELLVSYNSYLSKNGIVSVELTGNYSDSAMAHPIDIVKTFSADHESGEIVKIDGILAQGKRAETEKRLIEEFGINRDFYDGDLLEYWLIAEDCLKIILPRGEFLPMSDGTKSFTFTEKETKNLLRDAAEVRQKSYETKLCNFIFKMNLPCNIFAEVICFSPLDIRSNIDHIIHRIVLPARQVVLRGI